MKLIIENWNLFLEQGREKITIFFSGTGPSFKPNTLREKHKQRFQKWEIENKSKLVILNPYSKVPEIENVERIIGFSAGAAMAYHASKKYSNAKLILIDPWLATWRLKPKDLKEINAGIGNGNIEYIGTSKEISRISKSSGADNQNALRIAIPGLKLANIKHEKYFENYFNLGGDQVSTG